MFVFIFESKAWYENKKCNFTKDLNKHNSLRSLINEACVQRSTSKNMNEKNIFIYSIFWMQNKQR